MNKIFTIRKAATRGHSKLPWLDSKHSFSFADYWDDAYQQYGSLRVINDDRVAPGQGFGMHSHHNMEIISYVLSGTLAHKDSMGNEKLVTPGMFQAMSAGSGVRHSEYNKSQTESVHFIQIWIQPDTLGIAPRYQEITSSADEIQLIAGDSKSGAPIIIQQNARLSLLKPRIDKAIRLSINRASYLFVAAGALSIEETILEQGDALEISSANESESTNFEIKAIAGEPTQCLLFEV